MSIKGKKLEPIAPTSFHLSELLDDGQKADNHGEECNTFNEGGCNDHGRTDVATSFWLTGHTFHSTLTNLTDTQTCSDSGQTCSDGCTEITPGHLGC